MERMMKNSFQDDENDGYELIDIDDDEERQHRNDGNKSVMFVDFDKQEKPKKRRMSG